MKKKIFGAVFIALVAITAGWNYQQNKQRVELSGLALENVEALASGETGSNKCSDSCKEWSGNSGGGIACDCGRYTGRCKNRC